jgi:N-acetylglucosaminyldiphosphoundecaprenol N-acetyl-beta-D-mannosaminyltransferase
MNVASRDAIYHTILNRGDLVYPDGIGVVWSGWFLARGRMQKSTGADWIEQFCQLAARHGWRIAIIAGRPGIAHRARERLIERHPELAIVGAYDGFFHEKSQRDVLRELAQTSPHVLFVGMGTPVQEKWIAAYRNALPVRICWATGALFDYVAGVEPRVPTWMNMLALEWLWRLLVDPMGKWQRYIVGNPLFITRVLLQKLGQRHTTKEWTK